MKNAKEPRPMKSSPDLIVEPLFASPDLEFGDLREKRSASGNLRAMRKQRTVVGGVVVVGGAGIKWLIGRAGQMGDIARTRSRGWFETGTGRGEPANGADRCTRGRRRSRLGRRSYGIPLVEGGTTVDTHGLFHECG